MHPKTNIEKMSNGVALTDADREPWLELIRTTAEHMVAEQQAKASSAATEDVDVGRVGVMVTCSALKRFYRDILRGVQKPSKLPAHLDAPTPERLATYFVYIKAEERLLRERMANRQGHFMKPQMLDSQLSTLESPEGEDGVVVVPLDATTDEQVRVALEGLTALVGELHIEPTLERKQGGPENVEVPEDIGV